MTALVALSQMMVVQAARADHSAEVCQGTLLQNYQSVQGKLVKSITLEATRNDKYIYLVRWVSGTSQGTDRVWIDQEQCEIVQIIDL